MTDIDKLTVWANALTSVVEPDSTLQDDGYVGGDQPFAENHNWIWWQRDTKHNQLIERANYGKTQAAGISLHNQIGELYLTDSDWLHPYSSLNTKTLLSAPVDLCPGWNHTLRKHVVFAARIGYQGVTEIYNDDGGAITLVEHPLTLDDAAEKVDAICSDGQYLYVMTVGKPGFQATFYQFSINPWSDTKNWSFDSLLLFDQNNRGKNDLIIADADWIATVCTASAPSTGNSVLLIKKDGLSAKVGSGNAPGDSVYLSAPFLASNGTNLFFAVEDIGTRSPRICTANIADPTQATNPGGAVADIPLVANTGIGVGSIVHDGRLVHYVLANGKIYSYDWTRDISTGSFPQWQIQNTPAPQQRTEHPSAAFDGVHLWTLWEFDGIADDRNGFVIPINLAEEAMEESSAKFVNDPRIMIFAPQPDVVEMSNTKIVYADNCLFFAPDISDGLSPATEVHRIPNLQARKK